MAVREQENSSQGVVLHTSSSTLVGTGGDEGATQYFKLSAVALLWLITTQVPEILGALKGRKKYLL